MKLLIIIIIYFLLPTTYGQFEKFLSLMATGNFDFKTKGLAMNDAGFGIGLDATLFSKHKLQFLIETNADQFIGDKLLRVDAQGRHLTSAAIYSMNAGPQFFISK